MSENEHTDDATLNESEAVTVSEPADTDSPNEPEQAEPTDEEKAAAAAKQAEEEAAAKAEAERVEALVTEFINGLGTKDDEGKWVGGLMADHEKRDPTTGSIPEGVLNELKLAFAEIPAGAPRTKIKNWVDAQISDAMEDPDLSSFARSFFMVKKHSLIGGAATKAAAPKVVVDPTEAHVEATAALFLAPYLVHVAEGVAADWGQRVDARADELLPTARLYAAYMDRVSAFDELDEEAYGKLDDAAKSEYDATKAKLEEDGKQFAEVPEPIRQAFRLARGRAAGGSTTRTRKASTGGASATTTTTPRAPRGDGTRKNIATHILNAFKGKPVGTVLTIAEIVKTRSDEYGEESPSAGAVSARLFPNKQDPTDGDACTIPGIKGTLSADGRKAAQLTA